MAEAAAARPREEAEFRAAEAACRADAAEGRAAVAEARVVALTVAGAG